MTPIEFNYSEAFFLYLQGRSLEEIAENSGFRLDFLRTYASKHGWTGLRVVHNEMTTNALVRPDAKVSLALMENNRQVNLAQAQKFQGVIDFAIKQLQDEMTNGPKKYTVTTTDKKGNTKTETKTFERVTPKNIRDLACAAATVHDLTYRALGDIPAKKDPSQSDVTPRAQIILNLPPIMAEPRNITRVIDVAPETQSKDTKTTE